MQGIGGYQILDFKGIPLSNTVKNIPGVYESIERSNNKCMMAVNLTIDGLSFIPENMSCWVTATKDSKDWRLLCGIANTNQVWNIIIKVRASGDITASAQGAIPQTAQLSTEEVQ